MKRLRSVIAVEEEPAVKRRRRTRDKSRARRHAASSSPSFSFTHRNGISSVFNRLRRHQSAAKLLFEQIGRLRRHKIHCDSEGYFQGTAEVVYERWDDALVAARHYDNNINFFGRTWKVELVGEKEFSLLEVSRPSAAERGACKQTIQSRVHECGSTRGGGKRAPLRDSRKQKQDADLDEYYRQRQFARGEKRPTIREALDADLDRYHKHARKY